MRKIIPHLWFDDQAEDAAELYVSIFKNSKIKEITLYPKAAEEVSGKMAGSVMTVAFQLEGEDFVALNGGPEFKFSEAVSFMVSCEDQEEIDYYWNRLTEGGDAKAQICGWLKDKFGLSWQIVPTALNEMLTDKDPEKSERVMQKILSMKKIILADLEKAYEGK